MVQPKPTKGQIKSFYRKEKKAQKKVQDICKKFDILFVMNKETKAKRFVHEATQTDIQAGETAAEDVINLTNFIRSLRGGGLDIYK